MWFQLKGDSRLGRCASENCGDAPTWRIEADGVGSDYCSGCKEKIEAKPKRCAECTCEAGAPECNWIKT